MTTSRPLALLVAAAGLIGTLLLTNGSTVILRAAGLAWTTPENIELSGAGTAVTNAVLAMRNGRAAAVWLEGGTTVRAAYQPAGSAFGSAQTLDSQTALYSPSIAVGPDGQAIVVWAGENNPGPVRTVAVSDLVAGTTTFGAKATIFTSGTSQTPGDTNVGIDAGGNTLAVFRGDGNYYPYFHVWSAEREAAGEAWAVNSRTGNFEAAGVNMGLASDGAAVAYAWGIAQGTNHWIIGPRRNSSGVWFAEGPAPYSGATINSQHAGSVAMDGSDRAYITVDVCCNGGSPGPNFVMVNSDASVPQGAINPDGASFTAPAPQSTPHVVVDNAGNAVMAWIRSASTHELWAAYRAAGTATSFDTPVLISADLPSNFEGRYGLAMDSVGNAVIVWKEACAGSACSLKSKIRLAGGDSSFANLLTVASDVENSATLSVASDGGRNVGVLWRDTASPVNLRFSVLATDAPTQLAITSSADSLASGTSRAITAELRDAGGVVVASDSSTSVTFAQTSGSGSVTGLGSAAATSGVAFKSATGGMAGSVTITASASGLTSDATTFTVTAGAASELVVTSSTADLASAANRTITVEIRDASGNVITTDDSTVVTFAQTSGAGSVAGLGPATAASGVASKVIAGDAVGPVTISVTATGLTTGTTSFTIVPGAADHLTVTSSTASLASGTSRALVAEVRDENNNVVTTDEATSVTFAQTLGAGSLTGLGASTATSGIASKSATGGTVGSVTITASAPGLTSGTTTFSVTPGAADHIVITSATTSLMAGATRGITAEIRDAADNLITTDNSTFVTFSHTSGAGSVSGLGASAAASGVASKTVTGGTAGSVTLTASASGLTSSMTSFTVTTGALDHLTFTTSTAPLGTGLSRTIMAALRDAGDNLVASNSSTVVTFAKTAGTGSVTGLGSSTASGGVASKTITAATAGSVTIAASASGAASGTTTITVSGTPAYTDDPLTAGSTTMKAVHITELREAIAVLRSRYNLSVFTWTDATLGAGTTAFKAVHITEMRTALAAVYAAAMATAPTYTDGSLSAGGPIKAVYLAELRAAINAVW